MVPLDGFAPAQLLLGQLIEHRVAHSSSVPRRGRARSGLRGSCRTGADADRGHHHRAGAARDLPGSHRAAGSPAAQLPRGAGRHRAPGGPGRAAPPRRRRAAAAARRSGRDQRRRRRRRRTHAVRQQRGLDPGHPGRGSCQPATRGGRGDHRQNRCAGTDDLPVHRIADVRGDPQPMGHRAHAGRQQRRQRCRGGRRAGAAGAGLRRRRLDPHPVRLVRPVRAEAATRSGLAGAARRRVVRAERQRPDRAVGGRRRVVPRRDDDDARLPTADSSPRPPSIPAGCELR